MKINELKRMLSTYGFLELLRRCSEKLIEEPQRYRKLSVQLDEIPKLKPSYSSTDAPVNSEPLTVLIAVHTYFGSTGGTELFVHNLASRLKDTGHRPVIIAHCADIKKAFSNENGGVLWRENQEYGIELIEYRHVGKPRGLFTDLLSDDPHIRCFGNFLIEKYKPDVFHIAHLQKGSAFALACIDLGIPYIVTLTDFFCLCRYSTLIDSHGEYCHSRACDTKCKSASQSEKDRFEKAIVILNNAFAVCVPSKFVARRIQFEYGISSHVVPHGIDIPKIHSRREQHEIVRFLYVGKLSPLKGIHIVLPAMKKLNFPWNLVICGSGNPLYVRKLRQIAGKHDCISFVGQLKKPELWDAYMHADVVIVPSICPETYNYVLHEAMAAGCSVAVSPVGALSEFVEEGKNGAVFSGLSENEILSGLTIAATYSYMELPKPVTPDEECKEYIRLYNMGMKERG